MDLLFLAERFRSCRAELRVITGHFPLCTPDVLGAPFTTLTVLRHPVERTLSLLRHRKMVEERFRACELEEIYADHGLQNIIHNHMVKMLSLTPGEMTYAPLSMPVAFDEARLDLAKHNLEQRIDAFGLQEHFEEFCTELAARFGWNLGAARVSNQSHRHPVSTELQERIASDNRMDVELYRFAVQLREQRQHREDES